MSEIANRLAVKTNPADTVHIARSIKELKARPPTQISKSRHKVLRQGCKDALDMRNFSARPRFLA